MSWPFIVSLRSNPLESNLNENLFLRPMQVARRASQTHSFFYNRFRFNLYQYLR
jgi:hypothetical protein